MDDVIDIANYFTVTPVSQHFEALEPGQTYTGAISVINPVSATEDFNYSLYVAPYAVNDSDYSADLIKRNNYNQMADWITIDELNGSVAPNETKEIHFTITVPENAPAGGQYAAIVVSQDYSKDDANNNTLAVKNILEIASLIYADVQGETVHEGEILENNIPFFVAESPITLSALVTNHGNVHETATVMIEATDVFTKDIIVEAETEKDYYTELVMPETTKYIERSISENLPVLGIVHVEQAIYYNGSYSKEARDVIICPIWFLFIVVGTIGVIIAIIAHKVRQYRKKSKKRREKKEAQTKD